MYKKTGMQIILSKNQDFDLECEICDPVMSSLVFILMKWKEKVLPASSQHTAMTSAEPCQYRKAYHTLSIKLSTKNLRCFYTATATESDVTSYHSDF